jgi:hypothetical protein
LFTILSRFRADRPYFLFNNLTIFKDFMLFKRMLSRTDSLHLFKIYHNIYIFRRKINLFSSFLLLWNLQIFINKLQKKTYHISVKIKQFTHGNRDLIKKLINSKQFVRLNHGSLSLWNFFKCISILSYSFFSQHDILIFFRKNSNALK